MIRNSTEKTNTRDLNRLDTNLYKARDLKKGFKKSFIENSLENKEKNFFSYKSKLRGYNKGNQSINPMGMNLGVEQAQPSPWAGASPKPNQPSIVTVKNPIPKKDKEIYPNSRWLILCSRFLSLLMKNGEKSKSEKIVYQTLNKINQKTNLSNLYSLISEKKYRGFNPLSLQAKTRISQKNERNSLKGSLQKPFNEQPYGLDNGNGGFLLKEAGTKYLILQEKENNTPSVLPERLSLKGKRDRKQNPLFSHKNSCFFTNKGASLPSYKRWDGWLGNAQPSPDKPSQPTNGIEVSISLPLKKTKISALLEENYKTCNKNNVQETGHSTKDSSIGENPSKGSGLFFKGKFFYPKRFSKEKLLETPVLSAKKKKAPLWGWDKDGLMGWVGGVRPIVSTPSPSFFARGEGYVPPFSENSSIEKDKGRKLNLYNTTNKNTLPEFLKKKKLSNLKDKSTSFHSYRSTKGSTQKTDEKKYNKVLADSLCCTRILEESIKNVRPSIELRKVKRGRNTYTVPSLIKRKRGEKFGIQWILESAKKRRRKNKEPLHVALGAEVLQAFQKTGYGREKRNALFQQANLNRAYLRYRWW